MKTLNAVADFGRTKRVVALADIMVSDGVSVVDAAPNWAVFPRHLQLAASIATLGLQNPVVVMAEGAKYRYVASGGRIQFAVVNGYTHIDAIVLDNESEIRPLLIEQAKTEANYLDPQYISEWWNEKEAK